MKKKLAAAPRLAAALALVALLFSAVGGKGLAADSTVEEPDFLVLNPERE